MLSGIAAIVPDVMTQCVISIGLGTVNVIAKIMPEPLAKKLWHVYCNCNHNAYSITGIDLAWNMELQETGQVGKFRD